MELPPPPPPPGNLPPPPPPPSVAPPAWQNPMNYAPAPNYAAALNVVYAGFWIRFAAIFIDLFLLFVAYLLISFVVGFAIGFLVGMSGNEITAASETDINVISWIISLTLNAGYFSYNWGGGSTIGMRRFGLRVVDAAGGQPIGLSRGFVRWLGYIVSALPCYVGLIWAAFDPRKQGWHDKLANTVVIRV